ALAAGGLAWRQIASLETPLEPTIVAEDVVTDLSRHLDPASVAEQTTSDAVRAGVLDPGDPLAGHGARPGLITPPRPRLRFRLAPPPGAGLRFAVVVQGDGRRAPERSAVRFAVAADGREMWSRSVNPAARRDDRRWFDERIDLGHLAGR